MIVFSIDDLDIQLSKEQTDLFSPTSRKSDKSLPVDVPSTPEMDELFSSAFEINGSIRDDIDWNPNHKAVCMLVDSSGIPLLRGYAQLTEIVTKDIDKIYYRVQLYGKIKDLFTDIGEKLLIGNDNPADDLDFSEYAHTFDLDTIERSWEFDCDFNGTPQDLSNQGKGYLYPLIDFGNTPDLKTYEFNDFKPALYWWEILYKIFVKAGIRWDSAFFDTQRFKRLIFPFMGEQLLITDTEITNQSAGASRITTDQEISFYNTPSRGNGPDRSTGEILIFNNEINDPSLQYNSSTGEFTAGDNCEVVIEGDVTSYIKYTASTTKLYPATVPHDHYGKIVFEVIKDSGGGNYTPMGTFEVRTFFNNLAQVGGDDQLPQNTVSDVIPNEGSFQSVPIKLLSGEKLYIKAYYYRDDYFGSWYSQAVCYLGIGSTVSIRRTSTIVQGQSIDPTICLPNLKQKDFLSMVIKRFNLYLDPIDENVITIEPRDDFYTSETQKWESIRSTDQELSFFPMSLLDAKQYDFVHTKDDDLINQQYFNSYGYVYGRARVYTENEFLQETRVIEDGIAPTPSVNHFDRILPAIIYTDSGGQVTRKATKPRMLYYGGLKNCLAYTIKENGVSNSFTQYPYSGMIDDPYNPTFILTWGIPNEIFYDKYPTKDPLKMTTNNLFSEYWYNTIYQIANKDSRVVQGWFWIDAETYYNASFRDQYWFNNAYHRLLKIEDWVASSDKSLVKCTFLKLQKVITPEIISTEILGGNSGNGNGSGTGGVIIDAQRVPDRIRNAPLSGNGMSTGSGGADGSIGMIGLINASRTNIGVNSADITVLGLGVNIPAGQNNVTYINSDLPSPINNVTVINNLIQKTDIITLSSSDLGVIDSTPYLLVLNQIEGSSIYVQSVFGLITYDTDVYQNRDLHIINDDGDQLYYFGSNFTNNAADTRRAAERLHPNILNPDQNIYIESSGLLTTGLGELTIIINYTILML